MRFPRPQFLHSQHSRIALISELPQGLDELAHLQVSADVITLPDTNYTLAPALLVSHHTLRIELGALGYPWGVPP